MSNPQFYEAISTNQIDSVKQLLDSGTIRLNEYNPQGLTPLFCAIRAGNLEVVKVLVAAGADINMFDRANNYNPVIYALRLTQNVILEHLINCGAFLDSQNSSGVSALHLAVDEQSLYLCDLLLNNGSGINFVNSLGYTPLMLAAYKGNLQIVQLLIRFGANPFILDSSGFSALYYARHRNNLPVVTYLETFLSNLNSAIYDLYTPLAVAASRGDTNYIQQLHHHGADFNFVHPQTNKGILSLAVESQQIESVRLVALITNCANVVHPQHYVAIKKAIQLGSDVVFDYLIKNIGINTDAFEFLGLINVAILSNRMDRFQKLMLVIPNFNTRMLRHLQLYRYFIKKGLVTLTKQVFDPSIHATQGAVDSDGNNFLHLAVIYGQIEIIKFLALHININLVNNKYLSAVDLAIQNDQLDVLATLKELGADLEPSFNPQRNSSLMIAVRSGKMAAAQFLIESGVNLSKTNLAGETAMHIFANRYVTQDSNPEEFIALFKDRGFNFDKVDCDGNTPLMLAAEQGCSIKVSILLEAGANSSLRNKDNQTAYDLACVNQSYEVMELLKPKLHFQFFAPVANARCPIDQVEEDWFPKPDFG